MWEETLLNGITFRNWRVTFVEKAQLKIMNYKRNKHDKILDQTKLLRVLLKMKNASLFLNPLPPITRWRWCSNAMILAKWPPSLQICRITTRPRENVSQPQWHHGGRETVSWGLEVIMQIWRLGGHLICGDQCAYASPPSSHHNF